MVHVCFVKQKKSAKVELPAGGHQSYSDIDVTKHNTFTITVSNNDTNSISSCCVIGIV